MELKSVLEVALRSQEGLSGIEIHNLREVPCTKPGDNYMSVVGLVEIEGRLPGGVPYNASVFVKRQPKNKANRQMFQTEDFFINEVIMYNDVLPSYDVKVPCARCLFASSELVCLENLQAAGYAMADRRAGFDLDQATLAIKALVQMHVASYHALIVKKERITEAIKQMKVTGFMLTGHMELTESSMRRAIQKMQDQDVEEAVSFLHSITGRFSECLKSLRQSKDIEVLCHGDFWLNNILIREGDDPIRIVDLQTCAVLSPAVDVWSFIYSSIQPSVMESAIPLLLQYYCRTFLEELSIQKVPSVITAENLMSELLSRELYGYLVGLFYIPVLVMTDDNVPDLENISKDAFVDDSFMDQFMSPDIKGRMTDLSRIGIRRGLFKTAW